MKHFADKLDSWLKRIKITLIVLPVLALMVGCASPSASTVQSWPARPPAGYAMLMIYWNKLHWDEAGGGPSVYIDDQKVLKLHVNHYTWVYVRAGSHTLSTVWGFKIFGWNPLNGLNMKKEFIFADGETCYLKLRNWSNGGMYVQTIYTSLNQVDASTAEKEARTCWFTKPLVNQIDGGTNQPKMPSSDLK